MFEDSENVRQTLTRLSSLWKRRATVNGAPLEHHALEFCDDLPDFSEELLPFKEHPRWAFAPAELKRKVLSYAWIIYNLKTIYVECDIVTPACEDIIKVPMHCSSVRVELQEAMSEALLDEALHTKMSIGACNYIYRNRDLSPIALDGFNIIQWRRGLLSSCRSDSERRLVRFAVATASETLITDYLTKLAGDANIQPICREVTRAHAKDEWSHSGLFSVAAEHILAQLSYQERNRFAGIVRGTIDLFADNELEAWAAVFEAVSFPNWREIILDTPKMGGVAVYIESVGSLLNKLDLTAQPEIRLSDFSQL